MKFQSGLDWVRYTMPGMLSLAECVPAHRVFSIIGDEKPLPWYDTAVRMAAGRIDWHSKYPDRGKLVTLSGKGLREMRKAGFSQERLIEHIIGAKGSVTRVDFAIDAIGGGKTPDDFLAAIEAGKLETKTRRRMRWASNTGPEGKTAVTVQIGSRQSEKVLRIYDKAAEQGLKADIVRFEIEFKGRAARSVVEAMKSYGIQTTGKAAMKQYIDGNFSYWGRMVDTSDENPVIDPVGRKETDWEAWVLKTALPNVLKAYREGVESVVKIVNKELFGIIPPDDV